MPLIHGSQNISQRWFVGWQPVQSPRPSVALDNAPSAVCNSGRHAGTAGSARPLWPVLDRVVRALPALEERVGRRAGGDVCARCTRKVKEVTETLCGHGFSATLVSEMNRTLDTALTAF